VRVPSLGAARLGHEGRTETCGSIIRCKVTSLRACFTDHPAAAAVAVSAPWARLANTGGEATTVWLTNRNATVSGTIMQASCAGEQGPPLHQRLSIHYPPRRRWMHRCNSGMRVCCFRRGLPPSRCHPKLSGSKATYTVASKTETAFACLYLILAPMVHKRGLTGHFNESPNSRHHEMSFVAQLAGC